MADNKGDERIINIGPLRFNPGVSIVSFAILWGFAIWCMTDEDQAQAELTLWRDWVAYWFTWLYIGSQDIWIIFAVYVYYQYGHLKLCAPGDEKKPPEFSNASYFTMLFTCGVAVGMFFFGVTEPVTYFVDGTSRFHSTPGATDSERAQWAMTLTVFHWGLHGWIPYCIVALTLGFASFRQGKTLTMRNTLYPLLGDDINGWIGDSIDILSIVVVVAGVCTSLGLGTQQIAEGLYRLDQDIYDPAVEDELKDAWTVIIVCITAVACISVVSGIHVGIKFVSMTAFMLANFIWLMVFFLDDSTYFLDIMVQTLGHYLQYLVELGFTTDAFQRQRQHGTPNSEYVDAVNKPNYLFPGAPIDTYGIDASGNTLPDGARGGNPKFLQWWTIFYWGWWIAWSPFVGMFIARISKGRSIREVFNYSMTAPLIYVVLWFGVFGGAGIKMHNQAIECKNQETIRFDLMSGTNLHNEYRETVCCPIKTDLRSDGVWEILRVQGPIPSNMTEFGLVNQGMCEYLRPQNMNDTVSLADYRAGLSYTPVERTFLDGVTWVMNDKSRKAIYEFSYSPSANFFEVLEQYYGWGDFLSGVTIATIVLYFVTSSDSGSFVVDLISAGGNRDKNGNERDPHWVQRILWSITEGALAIGLMRAGGVGGTTALQAMSVAVGLPFTVVLCFMMPALLRMLQFEEGSAKMSDFTWKMPCYGGFLNIMDVIFSFGGLLGRSPSAKDLVASFQELVVGFLPFIHVFKVLGFLDVSGKKKNKNMLVAFAVLFLWVLWVTSLILERHSEYGGWFAMAATSYTFMIIILSYVRSKVRTAQQIKGSVIEDFLCCFAFYPNIGPQLWIQVNSDREKELKASSKEDVETGESTKRDAPPYEGIAKVSQI